MSTATQVRADTTTPGGRTDLRAPLSALALLGATVAVLAAVEAAGAVPDGTVLRGAAAYGAAAVVLLVGVGLLAHGLLRPGPRATPTRWDATCASTCSGVSPSSSSSSTTSS
jgi:hypothetical protein